MDKPKSQGYRELTAPILDRGATKHFRGRTVILDGFEGALRKIHHQKKGTTYLIEGPPGVGKTALLDQCIKRAWKNKWYVVEIGVPALYDPQAFKTALGESIKYNPPKVGGKIGIADILSLWAEKSPATQSVEQMIKNGVPSLMLVLDEAQYLAEAKFPSVSQETEIRDLIKLIHNGGMGRSVLLLAAGLRTTRQGFTRMGVSRFAEGYLAQLDRLGEESERAILKSWLVKGGKANSPVDEWIEKISRETHKWPSHIASYGNHGENVLKENKGRVTPEGLKEILRRGRKGRTIYYRQRMQGIKPHETLAFALTLEDLRIKNIFTSPSLLGRLEEMEGIKDAEALLKKLENEGVIQADDINYSIPIPSMRTWFVDLLQQAREKGIISKERNASDKGWDR